MKTNLQWVLAFSLLGMMSFFTLFNVSGGITSILGNVAQASGKVVVVESDTTSSSGWTKKFSRLVQDEVVCAVNDSQLADLTARYETTTEHVTIDGKDVTVVRVGGTTDAKSKDILNYLESNPDNLGCKLVKSHHWYYLLFSAHMS
jgi:ribosomal protein S15P/S13E